MTEVTDATTGPPRPHPRLPAWAGDTIAAVLIVTAAFLPIPGQDFRGPDLLFAIVSVLPAAILPFRRRWPVSVLAACLALFGVSSFSGTLSPGIALAVAIATFGVANRSSGRKTLLVAGGAVVAILLLSIPAAIGGFFEPRVAQLALAVAFGAAAGRGTRVQRQYIEAITERAERAERTREAEAQRRVSEERLRIARDLHDAVAHQIAVISLNAGVASSAIESKPEKARESLTTIRTASRAVLGEIGDLLGMLRADATTDVEGPQPGLARLTELVAQVENSGLQVTVRTEGDLAVVRGAADLVAFRVIQEALTNAHKYGSDGRAHVLVTVEPEAVHVVVTNPVSGRADGATGQGFGLIGMRERVASVRGTMRAEQIGTTWRLDVTIPLPKEGTP